MYSKGLETKQAILEAALTLASRFGLEGVTIGMLAEKLDLSKSGLFAHFRSKEALQIQILESASLHFVNYVIRPTIETPRGEPRIRALFDQWIKWTKLKTNPGGCIFIAAAAELDDRPGLVRDKLFEIQSEWWKTRTRIFETGQTTGFFKSDADCEQLAFEVHGILMSYHHAARLLKDPDAEKRARASFERLLSSARN